MIQDLRRNRVAESECVAGLMKDISVSRPEGLVVGSFDQIRKACEWVSKRRIELDEIERE